MTEPSNDRLGPTSRRVLAVVIASIIFIAVLAVIVFGYLSARLCYENMGYGLPGCPN